MNKKPFQPVNCTAINGCLRNAQLKVHIENDATIQILQKQQNMLLQNHRQNHNFDTTNNQLRVQNNDGPNEYDANNADKYVSPDENEKPKNTVIMGACQTKISGGAGVIHCRRCAWESQHLGQIVTHMLVEHNEIMSMSMFTKRLHRLRTQFRRSMLLSKCSQCQFRCVRASRLRLHGLTHDTERARGLVKCSECHLQCKSYAQLERHVYIHSYPGYAETHCPHCPFESKRKHELTRHLRKQCTARVSEMRFDCSKCEFTSKVRNSLRNHLLRVHNNRTALPLKCNQCQFVTKKLMELRQHCGALHGVDKAKSN